MPERITNCLLRSHQILPFTLASASTTYTRWRPTRLTFVKEKYFLQWTLLFYFKATIAGGRRSPLRGPSASPWTGSEPCVRLVRPLGPSDLGHQSGPSERPVAVTENRHTFAGQRLSAAAHTAPGHRGGPAPGPVPTRLATARLPVRYLPGTGRHGAARHGTARHGAARHGAARVQCTVEGKSKWHHQVFQDSFLLKR